MTPSILAVLVTVLLSIVALATERVAVEVVAIAVICVLVLSGVLTPEQAFSGFANPALMTIVGLMLMTGALIHNGAPDRASRLLQRASAGRERGALPLLLAAVAALSAWANNTAVTAMFVPVAEGMAKRAGGSASRYLMPVAFASMLGGCLTVIGTSTNLAVSGALEHLGMPALSMFELTPVGIFVAVIGLAYCSLVPFPSRADSASPSDAYGLRKYLFEVIVEPGSPFAGKSLEECSFLREHDLTVLGIERDGRRILATRADTRLEAGDVILVEGGLRGIASMPSVTGVVLGQQTRFRESDLVSSDVRLVEATISYNSPLIGWTLRGVAFRQRYGLNVLAVHTRGLAIVERIGRLTLKAGDTLLLQGTGDAVRRLAQEPPALLLEDVVLPVHDRRAEALSLALFAAAVALNAASIMPGSIVYLLGAALLIVARALTVQDAYQYLNLRLVVLVASMFALGEGMEQSGAAALLARCVIDVVGLESPTLLLAALCLLTVALTQPMSNAAAALLVLPVALQAAHLAGIEARGLVVGITMAASCSFITPFEPSCILVWDTGKYRFGDFVRMGAPLTLAALIAITILVPAIWPFRP